MVHEVNILNYESKSVKDINYYKKLSKEERWKNVDFYQSDLNKILCIPKKEIDNYKNLFLNISLRQQHWNISKICFNEKQKKNLIEKNKEEFAVAQLGSTELMINKLNDICEIKNNVFIPKKISSKELG
jgi:hypothetical protein